VNTDHQIILPDGRKLAFAEFGKPDGHPVLYFHGSPASRLARKRGRSRLSLILDIFFSGPNLSRRAASPVRASSAHRSA
jgi:hypothetical protein